MFKTGDRVSRDSVFQLATIERHGNVTYADKSARVAHVVFDNHTDGKPTLCTFESLKLITVPTMETPAHEDYSVIERFQELKKATPVMPIGVGDSVAFLYDKNPQHGKGTLTLAYGKKFDSKGAGTNGYRIGIVTRDGERFYVHFDHVTRIES